MAGNFNSTQWAIRFDPTRIRKWYNWYKQPSCPFGCIGNHSLLLSCYPPDFKDESTLTKLKQTQSSSCLFLLMIFSTASLSFSCGCNQTEQFQISSAKRGSDIHEAIGHGAHTHEHVQQEEDVNHRTYGASISNMPKSQGHILRKQRAPLFILCSACDNGNLATGLTSPEFEVAGWQLAGGTSTRSRQAHKFSSVTESLADLVPRSPCSECPTAWLVTVPRACAKNQVFRPKMLSFSKWLEIFLTLIQV